MAVKKYEIKGEETKENERGEKIKEGSRICGIAESFERGAYKKSVLAGVVQRMDGLIDDFSFSMAEIGGLDATTAVKRLMKRMERPDVQILILSGTVISYYNVIDLHEVYEDLQLPVIALTYEESSGIEKYLLEMDEGEKRLRIHKNNGERVHIDLKTGKKVFIRPVGLTSTKSKDILNSLTRHGKRPEPIRLAKFLAHSVFHFLMRIQDKRSSL